MKKFRLVVNWVFMFPIILLLYFLICFWMVIIVFTNDDLMIARCLNAVKAFNKELKGPRFGTGDKFFWERL